MFICEVKSNVNLSIPGFHCIRGTTASPNRGGVALLIKNYIFDRISRVDISVDDQIWFEIAGLDGVMFGGLYIPPMDSLYYSEV